jgi:hypothetical protein
VRPNVKISVTGNVNEKAIKKNKNESKICEINVDIFTLTQRKRQFFFNHANTYVSSILLSKKQERLARQSLGVVLKIILSASDAKSKSFGRNSSDICESTTSVMRDKKPIHADFLASVPPYFSFNISVAKDIEQKRALPNVTGIAKISTHLTTSMFAIIATIATHTNSPTLPNIL